MTNFNKNLRKLFDEQVTNWNLAKIGYNTLQTVETKVFQFDDFEIKVQFNPGRIVSSSAKVDPKSISERPCFLCKNSLPKEQNGIDLYSKYLILVNPFPIFPEHFTIPAFEHIPQSIYNSIEDMLIISKVLGDNYTVFYNGPKCGASAPDHMHFQAGTKGFMAIDIEYEKVIKKAKNIIYKDNKIVIYSKYDYLRYVISLESKSIELLVKKIQKIYEILQNSEEEPLLNILCNYTKESKWIVNIFPRKLHRPKQFFEEDESKLLLSPASVDFGGVCILPREEDFLKINKDILQNIFEQVTITKDKYEFLISEMKNKLVKLI